MVFAGLGMLIGDLPDMQVLAETGSADECLAAVRRIRRTAGWSSSWDWVSPASTTRCG